MDSSSIATCLSNSTDIKSMSDDYDLSSIKKSDLTKLTCENTETVLSVYWKNDMLGAAFFNSELSEIQILHDVIDNNFDFKILNYLFIQFRPAYIVVSNSQDQTFLKQVKQLAYNCKMNMHTSPTNDDYELDEKVNILPKKCFKFKTCEQLILSMTLALVPENEESRKRFIRSLVDFTQELAVCALGALLHFLDSPLIKFNLPTNFIVLSLRILHLDDVVWLCMSTYESLQIFSTREYSSVNNWTKKSNKKEPSIFSLLNRCSSVMGSIYLKNILTQPTKSINVLEYRHEVIEFCLNPCNESTILSLVKCIKHCRCVLLTMVKVNGGNASMYQWKLLYQTLINAMTIGEICERYAEQVKFFSKIKNALKSSLYTMANTMSSIIDFEQSTVHRRFIVKPGFMPELDEKKTKLENISQLLDTMTIQELIKLPSYIQECSICKMLDFGFLLCIPIWKSSKEMSEHDYKIENLEFKFQFSDNVYYKTSRCYELDQLFAEIESSIIQEEIQVMIKLCKVITQNWIGDLHEISKLIAELDW